MPRSTASERRAAVASAWASLLFAAARLTLSPSASPVQPSRSASAMRARRLSRISARRPRWSGEILRSGHLTQLCSWMQLVPYARPQSPSATRRRSKWPRNSSHSESVGERYSSLGRSSRRRVMNARWPRDGFLGIDRFIAHCGVYVVVSEYQLGDVRRHPVQDGVGGEEPPEIVGQEVERLPVGAGDAGRGERAAEEVADALGGDRPVLQADDPLEQQRHRRVPGALVRVIGRRPAGRRRRLPRTRVMTADRTSASSGSMTRSLSWSVFDGATDSSGTSSPEDGSRYWTRLWCESSVSSSSLMPVCRSTSMAAHAQNALSSSRVRSRRFPVSGSSAQIRREGRARRARRSVCPPAVNSSPGGAARAASSRAAASLRPRSTAAARAGRTGSRSRVRWSMRALVRDLLLLVAGCRCRGPGRERPTAPSGRARPAPTAPRSR